MKYKLGEKHPTKNLYRVVALKDFGDFKAGDIGGWVEGEHNLSQEGYCWIFGNALVFEDARVFGKAQVFGNARVYGNARVFGDALVFDNARVCDDAFVFGNSMVCDDAQVSGDAWVYGDNA
jgi:hypothetical protein